MVAEKPIFPMPPLIHTNEYDPIRPLEVKEKSCHPITQRNHPPFVALMDRIAVAHHWKECEGRHPMA